MTLDFRAVSYILNSPLYEKPWQTRSVLSRLLGRGASCLSTKATSSPITFLISGISALEGNDHKVLVSNILLPAYGVTKESRVLFMQRRLIGPAFTTQAVRATTPIFLQKAEELRDCWDTILSDDTTETTVSLSSTITPAEKVIDIAHWLSRATFDVIGLAGFDYHFRSLEDESEEVYHAYRRMFNVADKGPSLKGLLRIYFPFIETLLVSVS